MALLVFLQWNTPLLFAQSSPSENFLNLPFDSLYFLNQGNLQPTPKLPTISVIISLSEVCMLSQYYAREFEILSQTYSSDSVFFCGIFPNPFSSALEINAFAKTNKLHFPMARDLNGAYCKALSITKTPEVVVLRNGIKVYQGKVDDFYVAIGRHRTKTNYRYLEKALKSLLQGNKPDPAFSTSVGCIIDFRLWEKK